MVEDVACLTLGAWGVSKASYVPHAPACFGCCLHQRVPCLCMVRMPDASVRFFLSTCDGPSTAFAWIFLRRKLLRYMWLRVKHVSGNSFLVPRRFFSFFFMCESFQEACLKTILFPVCLRETGSAVYVQVQALARK